MTRALSSAVARIARSAARGVLAWVMLTLSMAPSRADGQELGSLAGSWHAEPMTVRWVIGQWGEACGPRPSGGGDSGGPVTIEEVGDELRITGGQGTYSTEQCWAMDPALVRQSHTGGRRAWKTTCRTPPNDARQQVLQTSITATDDVITFQESGQYQFAIRGQTCSASSGRWRTYRRTPAGAAPTEIPPPPREVPVEQPSRPAPSSNPCATPGPPARIEVRPGRKLMRAGETFQFRALVVDQRGCALRTAVTWSLSPPGSSAQLDGGRLEVPVGAPDAQLRVVATAAAQSVSASVDVVSNERYAALLATGEFDSEGASADAQTAIIGEGSVGAGELSEEPEPERRKWTFVALVGALALVLGAVGAFLLSRANRGRRRSRAKREAAADPGTVMFAEEKPKPTRTSADLTPAPPPAAEATRLAPLSQGVRAVSVCPVCGTLYEDRNLDACPKDRARLLPINA